MSCRDPRGCNPCCLVVLLHQHQMGMREKLSQCNTQVIQNNEEMRNSTNRKKRVLLISTLAILDPLEACGGSPGYQALIILLYFFSQTQWQQLLSQCNTRVAQNRKKEEYCSFLPILCYFEPLRTLVGGPKRSQSLFAHCSSSPHQLETTNDLV